MICYKDMAFCSAKCQTRKCTRNWRKLDKADYERWSASFDGGGPVAFADVSSTCEKYRPEVK